MFGSFIAACKNTPTVEINTYYEYSTYVSSYMKKTTRLKLALFDAYGEGMLVNFDQ